MATQSNEKEPYKTIREALAEAEALVAGDRAASYGDPRGAHHIIAGFWSTYLGQEVTPQDVAIMLTLMKLARLKACPDHHDSFVDSIAYMAIATAHQEAPPLEETVNTPEKKEEQ